MCPYRDCLAEGCGAQRHATHEHLARPDGSLAWMFRATGPAQRAWFTESLRAVDTTLMGRTNYREQSAHWPGQASEIATLVNEHEKVFFASTLPLVDWQNSPLATSSVVEEVAALKQQPGKNIYMTDGASFARSVIQPDLIDEVHPDCPSSGAGQQQAALWRSWQVGRLDAGRRASRRHRRRAAHLYARSRLNDCRAAWQEQAGDGRE